MDLPSLIRRTVGRTSAQTLPEDVIFLILVYLGMAADVFSMHFFKRTPIPPSEQKTFIKGLVQSSNVEVLTLVINWWRIPRKWFDDFLILESIRGDHVKSLRVLLHFWGLHLCCRNKCTHLHTCYRKRKCDYLINNAFSLGNHKTSISEKCIRFLVDEYEYPIDERFWMRSLTGPQIFHRLKTIYDMYPVVGYQHLSLLTRENITLVPRNRMMAWVVQEDRGDNKVSLYTFPGRSTNEHVTDVIDWLSSIGIIVRAIA
jgi:hypothetical protein